MPILYRKFSQVSPNLYATYGTCSNSTTSVVIYRIDTFYHHNKKIEFRWMQNKQTLKQKKCDIIAVWRGTVFIKLTDFKSDDSKD